MSELKAYTYDDMLDGAADVDVEYYPKSEADKVIARNKYKRCLAMAKWCKTSALCDEGLGALKYRDWYWKWFKRWLELADKLKEAK